MKRGRFPGCYIMQPGFFYAFPWFVESFFICILLLLQGPVVNLPLLTTNYFYETRIHAAK